jgi:hypothetical protein
MFLKEIGTCIMNLIKTLAWKVKLLLMIAINMLKLLKVLFLMSMLIYVEYLELVKRIKSKKIIVSTTGMKKTRMWYKPLNELGEKVVPSILLFVNFAIKWVISIFNAQDMIIAFLIQ